MKAKPEHEELYQDLALLINKHAGHLNGMEMLAVAANIVGKIVALQDQRKVTKKMAMELISKNIELGNKQIVDSMMNPEGEG